MSNPKDKTPSQKPSAGSRDFFATRLGVLAATLGSAVGLGNIWKFPSMTGTNGGAAFLFLYVLCVLIIGIPVLTAEHMLGKAGRANAVDTMNKLSNNKGAWWFIGIMGMIGSFLILGFYTEVAGWVLAYIPKAFSGTILTTDPETLNNAFGGMVSNPTASLIIQWVDLAIVGSILAFGISKGIEKATKFLLPVLLVLLAIVAIRSITLPNSWQSLVFLFKPDLSKITPAVILAAMGLAFFKLSTGMGVMMTYASYYPEDQNVPSNALKVVFSDMAIALLAGIAIFPAVFAYGFEPTIGAGLLFNTIPAVFASMPFGKFFLIIFLILTFIASIGAQISLAEILVTYLVEKTKLGRIKSALISVLALGAVGSLAALSNSTLADVKVFGLTFFDLFDYTSSNITLPLGGALICIFAGWVWGKEKFVAALTNNGTLNNERWVNILFFLVRYISPVLVVIVMLNGFHVFDIFLGK